MNNIALLTTTVLAVGYTNGFGKVETVVVKGAGGDPLIINKADYDADPKKHTLWKGDLPEPPAPAEEPPASPPEPSDADPIAEKILVLKEGTGKSAKYFISDGVGKKITGERATQLGVDENGYGTEAEAKAVQSKIEPKPAD